MYKFKINIDKEEYNKFLYGFSMAPITQDYRWANIKNNWSSLLCALYKDDTIVGVSLLLIKSFPMKLKMIYCPRGFLTDYTNIEYVKEFTKGLKEYAKEINAFLVRIDPQIAIKEEYYDTFINKENIDCIKNYSVDFDKKINNIKSSGFKHRGYKKELNAYSQPRYNAVINLMKDNEVELLNSFKRNAKRYYGEFQEKRGVSFICSHNTEYLDDFCKIIESTEKRQGISLRNKDYFKRIMDTYKEDAYMYISRIEVDKFISFLEKEIIKEKDEALKSKYNEQLVDAIKIKKEYGNIISLSATLAITPPNKDGIKKVEFLYAGTFEEAFSYLNTNVALHIYSFIDMLNMNYSYADLGGIDGSFKDHLSNTKEKYNPIILEYIGEFDMSINSFWYFIFSKFGVQLNKIYKVLRGKK